MKMRHVAASLAVLILATAPAIAQDQFPSSSVAIAHAAMPGVSSDSETLSDPPGEALCPSVEGIVGIILFASGHKLAVEKAVPLFNKTVPEDQRCHFGFKLRERTPFPAGHLPVDDVRYSITGSQVDVLVLIVTNPAGRRMKQLYRLPKHPVIYSFKGYASV